MLSDTTVESIDECNLTPRLDKMCRALADVPDDRLRYQQLLFLAQKAKPMQPELKTDETKVSFDKSLNSQSLPLLLRFVSMFRFITLSLR